MHSKKNRPSTHCKKVILYSRQKIQNRAELTAKKKYLLLNFTGLFVFFIFACILISCGKSGKSEPESEASPQTSRTANSTYRT